MTDFRPPRTATIPRPAPRTMPPASLNDPLENAMQDRRILQAEIASLNQQLTEALAINNGLRAEVDARVRELDRADDTIRDRDVTINRLRSYALSIRTRLAIFAEQAAAVHNEAMSESVESLMGEEYEAHDGHEEPAHAPDARPGIHEAPVRLAHQQPPEAVEKFGRNFGTDVPRR